MPTATQPWRRNPSLTDSIAVHEQRLSGTTVYYLTAEQLDSTTLAAIHSGDIIAFTTGIAGLDIAHVGIALQAGERHASYTPLRPRAGWSSKSGHSTRWSRTTAVSQAYA